MSETEAIAMKDEERDFEDKADVPLSGPPAPYLRFMSTSMSYALMMMLRRKRAILAGLIALTPVLIPLAMAMLTQGTLAKDGNNTFVMMVEMLYLKAIVPLLALFFGAMLIGEDVEAQTIPYLLTRPIPRTSLVFGRFLAYLLVSSGILIPSIFLTYAACTNLGGLSFSPTSLKLMLHYDMVIIMALLGYGSLCMCLGSFFKRPIIVGVAVLFGWQRLALYVPGLIDFFTIEKYVNALLPVLATEREKVVIKTAIATFQKKMFLVSATKAGVTLIVISVLLLLLTSLIIRWREYSQARAMEG